MESSQEKIKELRTLLYNLHKAWGDDQNKNGHCKSNEGYVGVTLNYPNWFETKDYLNAEPTVTVQVYSYLFGPSRIHDFNSLDEAIAEVKTWSYTPEDL
jgi:hypothetical protein